MAAELDTLEDAEASAVACRPSWPSSGHAAEVAGEFDARSDKPILRISRRHHGNVKSSVLTQDFVHGADYAALAEAADTFRWPAGRRRQGQRGEGDKPGRKSGDFRQAMAG